MAGEGVEAQATTADLLHHHVAIGTGVERDLLRRGLQGALHDADARALIPIAGSEQGVEALGQLQQGAATTSDDALLHGGPSGVEGILNAQLAIA